MFLGPQGLVFLDSKAWGLQYLFRDYVCASVCMHVRASVHVRACVCVCMSVWIVTVRATSYTEINSGSEGGESGAGCGQDAEEGREPLGSPLSLPSFLWPGVSQFGQRGHF